jgi:hypothetical protein
VAGFKLNAELARYLRDRPIGREQPARSAPTTSHSYYTLRWRVQDRLTETDVADFITEFKIGTPKWVLAERYGIGQKSGKQLLYQYGVRRRDDRGTTFGLERPRLSPRKSRRTDIES